MRSILISFGCFLALALAGQGVCEADRILQDEANAKRYHSIIRDLQVIESHDLIGQRALRYIPVVIHVIGSPGVQPVSLAQALHQIDVLNQDFSAHGENLHKLPAAFRDLVGAAEFRFCLASVDPEGLPSTGITYTPSDDPDIAFEYEFGMRRAIHYDDFGGKSGWDPQRYVNVWVVDYNQILGSATLPGMAPYDEEIGIVVNAEYFGSFGDAGAHTEFDGGHTLTHEMGHYLGLLHIWGQGFTPDCEDSDQIDDTPNAAGPHFGCPSGEIFSCGVSNLYQNFMDLSDDFCLSMFTHDQVSRMEATLTQFYPNLATDVPCGTPLTDADAWYDQLTWSSDVASDRIMIFHPEGYAGMVTVHVYSMDGRLVTRQVWSGDLALAIDMHGAGRGVFIICMEVDGEMRSRKIVHY